MVDPDRLLAAYETARCDLLAETEDSGRWVGRLSNSPLSTALALSALALVERRPNPSANGAPDATPSAGLCQTIVGGLRWLCQQQNDDGGWGDVERGASNIATTMAVRAAFQLTGLPAAEDDLLERADQYIADHGGAAGVLKHFDADNILAIGILTHCALAGLIPWSKVPHVRFELGSLLAKPERSKPGVSGEALGALAALAAVRHHHARPWNPIARGLRQLAIQRTLAVLDVQRPAGGGFLASVPLTSCVMMSLIGSGRADHPAVRAGAEFLLRAARTEGSWPAAPERAVWNTALSLAALTAAGENVVDSGALAWLLARQHRGHGPAGERSAGGWAASDLADAAPDADTTAGVLLSLAGMLRLVPQGRSAELRQAAVAGVKWLLDSQNNDGSWGMFSCGQQASALNAGGADLTAHALRALAAWRGVVVRGAGLASDVAAGLDERIAAALERGLRYLFAGQQADGGWLPSCHGNPYRGPQASAVYPTVKVLLALGDLGRLDSAGAVRGLEYLAQSQNRDGGWGGRPASEELESLQARSSVEETALAAEALLICGREEHHQRAERAIAWLIEAVQANRHEEPFPLGSYFARLWYYETLYPMIYTVAALGQAARRVRIQPANSPAARLGKA